MDSNTAKARSAIAWILAIACAFGAGWWLQKQTRQASPDQERSVAPLPPGALQASADIAPVPAPRALTPQEQQWARIAWSYFENNADPETALVPSIEGVPAATMWDTASTLMALIAAHDLGVIEKKTFDIRMAKALVSLERMPLYGKQLPNRSYDVRSLEMTDAQNQPVAAGTGWSAIDVGRLLVPLNVLAWHHAVHTPAARRVLARWDLAQLARDGQLSGMEPGSSGPPKPVQQGRMGYEQYAARALALVGLDVDVAADYRPYLQLVEVEGVQVCADNRQPQRSGAQDFVVSEPYILGGLEFGWTRQARECAWRTYKAQEQRFRKTGVLTAVSEDHVDQAPHLVYGSVWSGGRPWATVTATGEDASKLRSMSTKAAFGWHALFRTEYTARLVEQAAPLHDPARGFYAGRYDEGAKPNKVLTANTNAVILESLAYIRRGPFLQVRRPGDPKP